MIKKTTIVAFISITTMFFLKGTLYAESYNNRLPMMDTCGRVEMKPQEAEMFKSCIEQFLRFHAAERARMQGRRGSIEEEAIKERRVVQQCMKYHGMQLYGWVDSHGGLHPLEKKNTGLTALFEKQPELPKRGAECLSNPKLVEQEKRTSPKSTTGDIK